MIADKKNRLVVNINDLRRKNPKRAVKLLNNGFEEQLAFQKALKEYIFSVSMEYCKVFDEFFVAFEGSFGSKHVTPRSLHSRYLGNLVCVEGIVTKCKRCLCFFYIYLFVDGFLKFLIKIKIVFYVGSLIHPKVVKSVHYCPTTGKIMERKYTDLTSLDAFPSSMVYPTKVRNLKEIFYVKI